MFEITLANSSYIQLEPATANYVEQKVPPCPPPSAKPPTVGEVTSSVRESFTMHTDERASVMQRSVNHLNGESQRTT